MSEHHLRPLDLAIQDAQNRSKPIPFKMHAIDVTTLLVESVQLAKLAATEERDLEAIRSDFALRTQKLSQIHEEVMFMVEKEYSERGQQTALIHKQVELLIGLGQYEIARQILNRLTDILADSPLKNALNYRLHNQN